MLGTLPAGPWPAITLGRRRALDRRRQGQADRTHQRRRAAREPAAVGAAVGSPLPRRSALGLRGRAASRSRRRRGPDAQDSARKRRSSANADPAVNGGPSSTSSRTRPARTSSTIPTQRGPQAACSGPRSRPRRPTSRPTDGPTRSASVPGSGSLRPPARPSPPRRSRPPSSARCRRSSRPGGHPNPNRPAASHHRRRHGVRGRSRGAHRRHHGEGRHAHDPPDARHRRTPRPPQNVVLLSCSDRHACGAGRRQADPHPDGGPLPRASTSGRPGRPGAEPELRRRPASADRAHRLHRWGQGGRRDLARRGRDAPITSTAGP